MIRTLIKNRIKAVIYGILSQGKSSKPRHSKGRIILFALLFLYLGAVFVAMSAFLALSLASVLVPLGASWLYFSVFLLITLSVVFILSIFETKTELFENRDNELLLSMPIKPRDIVLSRIITVLIYNFIETSLIIVPAAVVYAALSGFEIRGTLGMLLLGLACSLLATALATGVGYLLSLITKRIKQKTLFTVILSFGFIFLYMAAYMRFMTGFETFFQNLGNSVDNIQQNYGILYYIGSAASLDFVPFIVIVAVCALACTVAFVVITKSYVSLVTSSQNTKKAYYKGKKLAKRSSLFALTKKELFKLKSSSLYILNSSLGLVFEIIIAVLAVVKRDMIFSVISSMGITAELVAPLFIVAIIALGSMNMMSASALSLEGNSFWILKSLPVDAKAVLWSKCLPHVLVTGVPTLIASVMFYIASASPIYYLPFFIIVPQMMNLFSAFFGLVLNVAFPKFNYENEAQVVKQSLPVFIVMFSQIIFSVGLFVLSLYLISVSALLTVFVLTAIILLISVAMYIILFKVSRGVYERMSV